ncbi:hypothetical protein B0T21DRAFT_159446 [Apiosordaria backusii]|uniref:EH domain-containing protein n=1 Tax=Apiosordaria backusii TaxID=314023 RepID=A0AA40BN16_9PEZI|nr:hypothetical protein B0T21DRAFT_159446 [Apiosordaria backusii]
MIVRDLKRLALLLCPLVALLFITVGLWHTQPEYLQGRVGEFLGRPLGSGPAVADNEEDKTPAPVAWGSHARPDPLPPPATWHNIFSTSTTDKKHFEIKFGDVPVFNPNILPHPTKNDTWMLMGQKWVDHNENTKGFIALEMGCDAQFSGDILKCVEEPKPLPIEPTTGNKCTGKFEPLNLNQGPHDARAFYGPTKPYTIFGSNSAFTCFGMWIQDFRTLVDWPAEPLVEDDFEVGTELQRPLPYGVLEKNFFAFWDKDDNMYIHYDMYPKRSFGAVDGKGAVIGSDLAPKAARHDAKCMARYMPTLAPELESIHQATNSLKVTLCKRTDEQCKPDDSNTFIMSIIQHKTYYNFHSEYEPYLVLFHQRAPFEMYAMSKKPIWIHGRRRDEVQRRTDMFYVTSMAWKDHGVKYHAYLDDVVFLGFGIEDNRAGGIDVRAGELLKGLGLCSDA